MSVCVCLCVCVCVCVYGWHQSAPDPSTAASPQRRHAPRTCGRKLGWLGLGAAIKLH